MLRSLVCRSAGANKSHKFKLNSAAASHLQIRSVKRLLSLCSQYLKMLLKKRTRCLCLAEPARTEPAQSMSFLSLPGLFRILLTLIIPTSQCKKGM